MKNEAFFVGVSDPVRFRKAISRFDQENARDPHREEFEGRAEPRELVYAKRLSSWVMRLAPVASEELRLASRCQHICRWEIPRDRYEMTRAGYLRWRADLKQFHAAKAGEILRESGYPDEMIIRVQELNLKKSFPRDPDSRILEDALCLIFLEFQFADLASRTDEAKVINALQKSWKKMTAQGHAHALELSLGAKEKALLATALAQ
jgi:hypothetical protein